MSKFKLGNGYSIVLYLFEIDSPSVYHVIRVLESI